MYLNKIYSVSHIKSVFGLYHWISTKLDMCIGIEKVWFGIADGQISSIFLTVICPGHVRIFLSGR